MNKKRLWRVSKIAAITVIAGLLAITTAIQIQRSLARRDAERLFEAFRSLQVGKTTPAEIQQLLIRWPRTAQATGDCSERCGFEIVQRDVAVKYGHVLSEHIALRRAYILLGGRPEQVRVAGEFRRGTLWFKSMGVYVDVQPHHDFAGGNTEYTLIAGVSFVPDSEIRLHRNGSHPAYAFEIGGGCSMCVRIGVVFAPDANRSDVDRLMQFQFRCLTAWRNPCRTPADIMPAAWKQASREAGF